MSSSKPGGKQPFWAAAIQDRRRPSRPAPAEERSPRRSRRSASAPPPPGAGAGDAPEGVPSELPASTLYTPARPAPGRPVRRTFRAGVETTRPAGTGEGAPAAVRPPVRPGASGRPGAPVKPADPAVVAQARERRESKRTPASWAARIVARSSAEVPADRELRATLKSIDLLKPDDARWISRAVFSYFRWHEWLDQGRALEKRLDQAMGFADTYSRHPHAVKDEALRMGAVPEWIGTVMDVPIGWLRALQREPRLWLRGRPGTAPRLSLTLGGTPDAIPGVLPDSLEYKGGRDLFRTGAFHRGEFEIQDVASQAVGHCCAPGSSGAPEKWWDVCAGEGGKTLHLSDLLAGKGEVLATDRAKWRLDRLQQRSSRAKSQGIRWSLWDEGRPVPAAGGFDGVLLDAPCSGVGTWGRNPHARWTTTPKDVEELAECQKRLLESACKGVKPGGKLIYAVCTLTRPETTEVVAAFSAKHPEFEPCVIPHPFDPAAAPSAERMFWPQDTGGNGMFVAGWRRKEISASKPQAPTPAAAS